jgi:hypothetical protein
VNARSSWASISSILLRTMATASPNIVAARDQARAAPGHRRLHQGRSLDGPVSRGEATFPALSEGCRTGQCSTIPTTAPCVRWSSRCCG